MAYKGAYMVAYGGIYGDIRGHIGLHIGLHMKGKSDMLNLCCICSDFANCLS